jgi:hypothetical protein
MSNDVLLGGTPGAFKGWKKKIPERMRKLRDEREQLGGLEAGEEHVRINNQSLWLRSLRLQFLPVSHSHRSAYFVAQSQAIVIGERAVFGHAIEDDQQQVSERLERSGWNARQHQKKSKSL